MATTYDYTPRRRVIMQFAMFGVLLGTVGLAALVDQRIGGWSAPLLGSERTLGSLHFRLPSDWGQVARSQRAPGASMIVRDNNGTSESQRTLAVFRQHVPRGMTAQEYLERMFVSDVFGDSEPEVGRTKLGSIPAIRLSGASAVRIGDGIMIEGDVVICGVFPNGQAVTLWLYKYGQLTGSDIRLLEMVAASFRLDGGTTQP